MCGRYTISHSLDEIVSHFNVVWDEPLLPNFNAAPSQSLPVIGSDSKSKLQLMKWGLVPFWAKEIKIGYKMINARVETIAEKPSFRSLITKRRCLVLSDGFYEWKKEENRKQPYRITKKSNELFSFAGLWDCWTNEKGDKIRTFTILTTKANKFMSKIHDRMPLILNRESELKWLDLKMSKEEVLTMIKQSYPEDLLKAYPVSLRVNSAKNNDPLLISEIK